MATFLLYGKHEITISKKELLYSDAILELNHIAAELGSAYRSLYKAYGSWIEFYINGEQDGWELINQAATVVVKTYVDIGIFDVTASDVQAHTLESIWEWKKLWQRIYSIQDKMDECYQEVCEYRDERKRLRSRTATLGFGVGGTVAGAIASEATYAATGLMHGLANTIANSSDKANIKRAFQSLYNDSEFQDKVIYQLWLAVYGLHYEKLKVLGVGEKDRLPKNKSKAEALL